MDTDSENRWAVYPIEKIEAAIANLNEAITEARRVQRESIIKQAKPIDENALNKLLCRGCQDHLTRYGEIEPIHIWLDGCTTEACTATAERKLALKEYFEKIQLGKI